MVGADPVPVEEPAARVGGQGPLSALYAKAAGLLRLSENQQAPLLAFIDGLVLLDILQKWGKTSFNPRPSDILNFDVIFLLLHVLASGNTR
jgi:hypothetical protein